jgi:hypothetical protein
LFFRILEGEPAAIDAVFKRIALDKRHTRIMRIIQEPTEARNFCEWTKGRADLSVNELKGIPGVMSAETTQVLRQATSRH